MNFKIHDYQIQKYKIPGGKVGSGGGGRQNGVGVGCTARLVGDLLGLPVCEGLEARDVPGKLVIHGGLGWRGLANLQSDGVRHPLGLVGH